MNISVKWLLSINLLICGSICLQSCQGSLEQNSDKRIEASNSNDKIQILLLGVYHFNNPGMDEHNIEVDDYFSERRQAEIDEVNGKLAEFQPNKIFIEWKRQEDQAYTDSMYQAFLKGDLDLQKLKSGRNEVYQLGFKIGKLTGIEELTCVDADGVWLGQWVNFIADTLQNKYYLRESEKIRRDFEDYNSKFNSRTVLENLIETNQWESIMDNHRYYNDLAIRVKDTVGIYFANQERTDTIAGMEYTLRSYDFENIGVELVTEWYKRNFLTYRNILENSRPGDRIILIFGQGHIRILHHMLNDNPNFAVIDPLDYLAH